MAPPDGGDSIGESGDDEVLSGSSDDELIFIPQGFNGSRGARAEDDELEELDMDTGSGGLSALDLGVTGDTERLRAREGTPPARGLK